MLEWLRAADHWLFHKINAVWTHPWLDAFLPVLTDLHKYKVFVYGALPVALLWWLHAKRGSAVKAILCAALAIGLTDAVNHRLVKPAFQRVRPQAHVLRSPRHYGRSFPSNHAANTAAAAMALNAAAPGPIGAAAVVVAALISYSRVYVGVHYPADVLAGALVGSLLGWLVVLLFRRLKLLKR